MQQLNLHDANLMRRSKHYTVTSLPQMRLGDGG